MKFVPADAKNLSIERRQNTGSTEARVHHKLADLTFLTCVRGDMKAVFLQRKPPILAEKQPDVTDDFSSHDRDDVTR